MPVKIIVKRNEQLCYHVMKNQYSFTAFWSMVAMNNFIDASNDYGKHNKNIRIHSMS